MPAYNAAGAVIAKGSLPTTPVAAPSGGDALVTLTAPIFEKRDLGVGGPGVFRGVGVKGRGAATHLLYRAGDVVKQSVLDALYPTTTISTVVPNNGAAGSEFVITGTFLNRVTAVKIGATAVTNFRVENDLTIRGVRPAGATGTSFTVTADGTDVTK
jgi:hypothetical protein